MAYVAKQDIPWGGVLAYSRGQRVEADAVKANDWQDLVVGEDSKEAAAIHAEITGRPVGDTKPSRAAAASGTEQKG